MQWSTWLGMGCWARRIWKNNHQPSGKHFVPSLGRAICCCSRQCSPKRRSKAVVHRVLPHWLVLFLFLFTQYLKLWTRHSCRAPFPFDKVLSLFLLLSRNDLHTVCHHLTRGRRDRKGICHRSREITVGEPTYVAHLETLGMRSPWCVMSWAAPTRELVNALGLYRRPLCAQWTCVFTLVWEGIDFRSSLQFPSHICSLDCIYLHL